jgi:hypothetical protein
LVVLAEAGVWVYVAVGFRVLVSGEVMLLLLDVQDLAMSVVFGLGYLGIIFEEFLAFNKSGVGLLMAVTLWVIRSIGVYSQPLTNLFIIIFVNSWETLGEMEKNPGNCYESHWVVLNHLQAQNPVSQGRVYDR